MPILLIFLSVFAEASSIKEFSFKDGKTSTTVPFELIDNRIFVKIKTASSEPLWMIFDTGGGNSLTPDAADKLGLKTKSRNPVSGVGEKKIQATEGRLDQYELGDIVMKDQDFWVFDLSPIQRAFKFEKLDGIIGYEILRNCVATIDFDQKVIHFTDSDRFQETKFAQGKKIGFRLSSDKPVIQAQVNGIPSEFLVDTGDRSAFTLFKKFAAAQKLEQNFGSKEMVTGYGVGGPVPARLGKTSLVLGSGEVTLPDVLTRLPTTTKGYFAESPLAGSIGNEVLKRYIVSFDYSRKVMTLRDTSKKHGPYVFSPVIGL